MPSYSTAVSVFDFSLLLKCEGQICQHFKASTIQLMWAFSAPLKTKPFKTHVFKILKLIRMWKRSWLHEKEMNNRRKKGAF